MQPKLISQNSESELERRRLHRDVARILVDLTANLLRVAGGTGKPDLVIPQAAALVDAAGRYTRLTGQQPPLAGLLSLHARDDLRLETLPAHDQALIAAKNQMIVGALQILAARLLGQKTQERRGDLMMLGDGKQAWEAALREARIARLNPKAEK